MPRPLRLGGLQVNVLTSDWLPGLSRGKGAVGPGFQRIAHRQPFLVAFEQLERRKIFLGGGVRQRVHVKLEIEGVGGRFISAQNTRQDVRAGTGFVDLRGAKSLHNRIAWPVSVQMNIAMAITRQINYVANGGPWFQYAL